MDQNYKIIGGDGQEYGPVSLHELKSWISDGRVAALTQVWNSDNGRWSPALQYMELHPEIGAIADLSTREKIPARAHVGFWPRVGAYLIDIVILNLVSFLILGPQNVNLPGLGASMSEITAFWEAAGPRLGGEVLLTMLYTVVLTGWLGATLGKLAIGARIVNADGSQISFGKALQRWLASLVSSLTFGLGYLMVAFRSDRRALHDLIAGTQVVYHRS